MKISTVNTGNNTSIMASKKSTAKAGQSTFVDDAKNFMDKNTPSFVKKLIPEEFLRFNNNRNMLNKASVDASYANLPKKNGKVDLKRVNDCRKKAIDFITKKNKEAYDIQIKDISIFASIARTIYLPSVRCPDHLGFEIYEGDKLIGFTSQNLFIDETKYEEDYVPRYKIIAYDRFLMSSKPSQYKSSEDDSVLYGVGNI